MPSEDAKILEFNQYQKIYKKPFIRSWVYIRIHMIEYIHPKQK